MEEDLGFNTEQICSNCAEAMELLDEVILVQVLYQQYTPDGPQFYSIEDSGDFVYTPHYFCLDCWEKLVLELAELVDETPPVQKAGAVYECPVCSSDVLDMENVVVSTIGELRRSRRMPSGQPTCYFEGIQKPKVACARCAMRINNYIIQLWEDAFEDEDDAEVDDNAALQRQQELACYAGFQRG